MQGFMCACLVAEGSRCRYDITQTLERIGVYMSKRMTVVFDDEDLYTALKVEAVRRG